jgi:hypothetical protein
LLHAPDAPPGSDIPGIQSGPLSRKGGAVFISGPLPGSTVSNCPLPGSFSLLGFAGSGFFFHFRAASFTPQDQNDGHQYKNQNSDCLTQNTRHIASFSIKVHRFADTCSLEGAIRSSRREPGICVNRHPTCRCRVSSHPLDTKVENRQPDSVLKNCPLLKTASALRKQGHFSTNGYRKRILGGART